MKQLTKIAFCILASMADTSSATPITVNFSGNVLSSYSNPSWVGAPLSGSFTIYPENIMSRFSYSSATGSKVYTFLGPAYGIYGSPVIDYSVALPDGSVYRAPHEGEYAEWGGINVVHGLGQESYSVGLQIQPLDRSYQADFFFILENAFHDGALVSSPDIHQIPNVGGATYVNAYLSVFNYKTMTHEVHARFSVGTPEPHHVPEPASWILVLTAGGSYWVARRSSSRRSRTKS